MSIYEKVNTDILIYNVNKNIGLGDMIIGMIRVEDTPEEILNVYQNEEMCMIAVKNWGLVLQYVRKDLQTEEMCMIAVKNWGSSLKWVRSDLQTEEMCMIAVKQSSWNLVSVREDLQTQEMCGTAVRKDYKLIKYVREDLRETCKDLWC